ncbi:MAG: hypothetical protein KTR32_31600 [Granulosicoccus sp.]|nr:hypothetical protein [Granulosicoccus sp.]
MKKPLSTILFFAIVLVGIAVYWKTGNISHDTGESAGSSDKDRVAAISEKERATSEFIAHSPGGFIPNTDGYDAIWTLFYALTIDINYFRTFEYFRQTSTIFLPEGETPPSIGADIPLPAAVQEYIKVNNIPATAPWHNLDSDVKVSGLDLKDKWNEPIRFSLRMDDSTLSYVLAEKLYNADGLLDRGTAIDFPLGALELKTSWIWIDTKDPQEKLAELQPHYYIAYAYYMDGSGQYQIGQAALTGFHQVLKSQPGWLWSTFENTHNSEFTQITYELPIPPEVDFVNQKWQKLLKSKQSVFANYQLNGAQVSFVENNEPVLLANSQIESFFQDNSSCKTCHHIAAYKADERLQFFNIVDSTGQGTTYYIGDPPDLSGWTSMDYAWSLKRAQFVRD